MALTYDLEEFAALPGTDDVLADEDRAIALLKVAQNLFWQATKITDDPTDPNEAYMVRLALYDMATYLFVSRDNLDATYTKFQSEKVGSYSYTKASGNASVAIREGAATGVELFDAAVAYFRNKLSEFCDGQTYSAEQVFTPNSFARVYQEIHPSYGVGGGGTDYDDYRKFGGSPL
jgi:hypothetical protein